MNIKKLIADAEAYDEEEISEFKKTLNHRLKIGFKDFTLDISNILSSIMDIENMRIIPVFYAQLAIYAETYHKDKTLQPIIWEEINGVLIKNVLHTGLTEFSERCIKLVELFSEHFPDYPVDAVNEKGETLLMAALGSSAATTPLVKVLIAMNANINAENMDGALPLHYLVANAKPPHLERLKLLVAAGANPADQRPFTTPSDNDFYTVSPGTGRYDSFEAFVNVMRDKWISSKGDAIKSDLDAVEAMILKYKSMNISMNAIKDSGTTSRRAFNL